MWFKVDDKLHEHKKVRRMDYDLAAIGLWTLCGSWSGDTRSDGFIPRTIPRRWVPSQARIDKLANKLVVVGMWEPAEVDGEKGWRFHDWSVYNPLEEEQTDLGKRRWRRKNALSKNADLRERVQQRDRNLCRYCGIRVDWANKSGPRGATYDHVDPEGDNTYENVVVACRRCNGRKCNRTPEEAGMPLLAVPAPYLPELAPELTPGANGVGSGLATPTQDGAESGRDRLGAGPRRGAELEPDPLLDRVLEPT